MPTPNDVRPSSAAGMPCTGRCPRGSQMVLQSDRLRALSAPVHMLVVTLILEVNMG